MGGDSQHPFVVTVAAMLRAAGFETVTPDLRGRILGNLWSVVQERVAIYDRFPIPFPGYDFLHSQRVYFPLAGNGHDVDMILVLADYRPRPSRRNPAYSGQRIGPAQPADWNAAVTS